MPQSAGESPRDILGRAEQEVARSEIDLEPALTISVIGPVFPAAAGQEPAGEQPPVAAEQVTVQAPVGWFIQEAGPVSPHHGDLFDHARIVSGGNGARLRRRMPPRIGQRLMDEAEVAATEQAVADFEIGVKERLVVEAVRPFPDQVGAKKQRRRAPEDVDLVEKRRAARSEEHTSELQSLMRISYAVFCLKKKK